MFEDVDILKDVVDVIVIDVLQDVDVIVKTFIGWRTTFPRDETTTLQKADKQNVDSKKNSYNSTVGGHV